MFRIERPKRAMAPVVVEIPHAGIDLPADVAVVTGADEHTRRRDADLYVDALYAEAVALGATVLVAELSRYAVDLNRDETDVDDATVEGAPNREVSSPRGVVWRETSDGRPALRRRLTRVEFHERIERYHRPYHTALTTVMHDLHARYGQVMLLSAHSMPSAGRDVPASRGKRRADIVPGTRGRSTAAPRWIDAVDTHFRAAGLSVMHDDPYRGGATTQRWGRPLEGFHAVQVEINRGLYMDEQTLVRRNGRFEWLASLCTGLVARLIEATAHGP